MIHSVISDVIRSLVAEPMNMVGWHSGNSYPTALALLWRDSANAKPLRYITYNGKYLVVKNV